MHAEQICSLLSNARRTNAIKLLREHGSITERELYRSIAEREHDGGESFTAVKKRIHVAMLQNHLPQLDDADVIHREQRTITPGPNFDAVARALDSVQGVAQ